MSFTVLGLNHQTAPVALRERVSVAENQQQQALQSLMQVAGVQTAVLLSTCNRTELYCQHDPDCAPPLATWLAEYHRIELAELQAHLYCYENESAVQHLLRVSAGVDSLILGEPQILGQVKQAWSLSKHNQCVHGALDRLFQHAFASAKRIRTETQIGAHPVSVAFASVKLARQLFSQLETATVLLIGAGETIELCAQHVFNANVKRLLIANRTHDNAQKIASRYAGLALPLAEFPKHLAETDIVICATSSAHAVLMKSDIAHAMAQRKHKPMLLIDLAVPRDIEASVAELDDVYLYTVDDLEQALSESRAFRKQAAQDAEKQIALDTEHFIRNLHADAQQNSMLKIREHVQQQRDFALDKAKQALARGENPERILETLANQLSNKFLHAPTARLRVAALENDQELLRAAERLFQWDDDVKS